MFSQLCRAKPRTLWEKIALRHPVTGARTSEGDAPQQVDLGFDDPRCQLEHCTFCDYKVCCQVTADYSKDNPNIQSFQCLKSTENPAYGLSAKSWLETSDSDQDEELASTNVNESMESSFNDALQIHSTKAPIISRGTSQPVTDCDATTTPMKMNISPQNPIQSNPEMRCQRLEAICERPKLEKTNDPRYGDLTWSVLKHRQIVSDASENCDNSCVIEHSISDIISSDPQLNSHEKRGIEMKSKRHIKDRSFPLSFVKPIAKISEKKLDIPTHQSNQVFKSDLIRQKPLQKTSCPPTRNKSDEGNKKSCSDILEDPLSNIAQVKTEESIQEWLARISDSSNGIFEEEIHGSSTGSAWDIRHLKEKDTLWNETAQVINKGLQEALEISHNRTETTSHYDVEYSSQDDDANSLLHGASKASPANLPMVVMQCSRLHSHIGSKPPFQQTSLPMGTLVTALYQESDWLYVQTPHGVEGFIIASNCVPIGTTNDPGSRRPWEPCDFPIEINVGKKYEFGRQQGAYIPAKLPTNHKQSVPYVNTVKMKTNFYNDRYFSHTFKSKDSIKTAKTVTDILRNSPETKVSNQ